VKYLLIICHDGAFVPSDDLVERILEWEAKMQQRGIRLTGNPLRPPGDAVTVRVREGKAAVTSGPFTAAAEQMAAYDLLECRTIEEAVEAASSHPMAAAGTIEVRPVWEGLAGGR
jgi:hypothetical protein